MARKLNTRLLLYLVIFVGVPVAVFLFVVLSRPGGLAGDPKEYLARAKNYMEHEQWPQAFLDIKKAAKLDPKSNEIRYLLGRIALYQDPPALNAARQSFEAVIVSDPTNFEARRDLAELYVLPPVELRPPFGTGRKTAHDLPLPLLYMLSGRGGPWRTSPDLALREIDSLIKLKPDYAPGHLWGAIVEMLVGDTKPLKQDSAVCYEDAVRRCRAGIQQVPHSLDLYRLLTQALTKLEQGDDKISEVLQEAVQNNPKDPEAHLLEANWLISKDKSDEAVQVLDEGLKQGGETAGLYLALGEVAARRNQAEPAREYFQKSLVLDPKQEGAYLRLSALYRLDNDREKAADILKKGAEQVPDSIPLMTDLADLDLELARIADADALIAQIEKLNPDGGDVAYLRGKRAMIDRQVHLAITYLRQAREQKVTPRVILLLGRAYYAAGELGAARQELTDLLAMVPGLTSARRMLADIQLRLQDYDEVLRNASILLQADPQDVEIRMLAAQALLAQRKVEEALAQAQMAADRSKDDPRPLILLAGIQQRLNRLPQAEATLLRAKALDKNPEVVYRALIGFYRATNQPKKLNAAIEEARVRMPDAVIVAEDETPQEVEAMLRNRLAESPSPRNKLALANLLTVTGHPEEGLALFDAVLNEADAKSFEWRTAWQSAFTSRLSAGDYEAAVKLIDRLRTVDPQAAELLFADALLALRQGKLAEATKQLQDVVAKNPVSAAYLLLGQVLMQQNRLDEARQALQQALTLRPDLVMARILLGHIHLRQGNYAGALAETKEALGFAPNSVALMELKAAAQAGEGQWDEAIKTREDIGRLVPDNVANLLPLAGLYYQRNRMADAEAKYRAAYRLSPKDLRVVQAMADFLARTARRPEGEAIIETYINENPDKPEGYVLRGDFVAEYGTIEQSEVSYRRAFALKPDDPLPLLRIGDHYASTQQWDKAEAVYNEVVAKFKDNGPAWKRLADTYMLQGDLGKAQTMIEKVLEQNPKDAQALVVRGRIAARNQNLEEARQYMRKALDITPTYGEARFWLATLYTSSDPLQSLEILDQIDPSDAAYEKAMLLRSSISTRRGQLRQAIVDLRQLLTFRPTSVMGRYTLAERYMATGEYSKAADVLAELVRDDKDPMVLVRLSEALFRSERYEEALTRAEQARAAKPESPEALVAEARCLIALNRKDEAIRRIQSVMDVYHEAWPRLALVAVYEMTGQPDKAIEALATGLIAQPTWEEGYVQEAAILRRVAETAPPANRQGIIQRARQVLLEGLTRIPGSIAIRTQLGGMEIDDGNYSQSLQVLQSLAEAFRSKYSRLQEDLPGLRPYIPGVRFYSLGLYYSGKVDEAIGWSTMLWELDPTEVANANNLAWILAVEKKQYDEAWQIIQRVLRLVPDEPQILDTAGWIAYLKGDYQTASANLQRSIQRKDNSEAHYHLAYVFEAITRPDDARDEYKKALDMGGLKARDKQDAEQRLKALGET